MTGNWVQKSSVGPSRPLSTGHFIMNWDTAYAFQAKSDLDARDCLLSFQHLPECHQLHFLQMACEKLCKAHLASRGSKPEDLRSSHAFIAKPLTAIVRRSLGREAGKVDSNSWIVAAIQKLARQIELLAPSVDAGGTIPANCEYPWCLPNGDLTVPAAHRFRLNLLHEKAGTTLLKIIRSSIDELLDKSAETEK